MRGFLGGVAIGALVSGMGAALVSLAVPFPKSIDVASEDPLGVTQPDVATGDSDAQISQGLFTGDADLVEAAPVAPKDPNARGNTAGLDQDALEPARKPAVTEETTALKLTDTAPRQVQIVPETAPPNLPSADSLPAPDVPLDELAPIVETTSAPLPENEPEAIVLEEDPITEARIDAVIEDTPSEETVSEEPVAGSDHAEPDQTVALPDNVSAEDAPVDVALEESPEAPAAAENTEDPKPTPPQIALNIPAIAAPELATGLPGLTLPQVSDRPETQRLPEETEELAQETTGENRPRIGKPGAQLATQGSTETQESTETQAEVSQADADLPAYVRNAEEFIALDDRPLMSIVLIDAEKSIGAEALVDFPYPLSFAIRADDPDAQKKAAAHRAAGFEVLMLVDLPRDAAPKEAETAMEVWAPKLPQAVGILEGVDTGFQGNRPLSDQMAALSGARGYGLVTQAKGLNTAQKLAQRDGVPSAVVFRDFDGAGQDPRAIRRFLDQAAFRAGQEGAVVMLGRLQPDTISALLLWGLQDRASRVQLAPVSASLQTGPSAEQ